MDKNLSSSSIEAVQETVPEAVPEDAISATSTASSTASNPSMASTATSATSAATSASLASLASSCANMTLYVSNVTGKKTNVSYPYEAKVNSLEALKKAVQYDHVSAKYADKKSKSGHVIKAYRSKSGFMFSDCLPMDCDNSNPNPLQADLSESEWKTPEDVKSAFPNVPFYVVYSRNHMKEKDGKSARPKFHVYFPLKSGFKSIKKYEALKQVTLAAFPYFDNNAIDGARFFFGVENPKVKYFAGDIKIDEFLASELAAIDFKLPKKIQTGTRNSTLLSLALKALKRFGPKIAMSKFIEGAKRCEEPLPIKELETIWDNAVKFYENKIADENYVLPAEFNRALNDAMNKDGIQGGYNNGYNNGYNSHDSDYDRDDDDSDEADNKKLSTKDVLEALDFLGVNIRLNVVTGKSRIKGMSKEHSDTNAANVLPTDIRDYFAVQRNLNVSRQFIEDSLAKIEDANRYNPIEEMLKNTKPDKKDRIKEVCDILYLEEGSDEMIYLKKWLHQCIALALNNDCRSTDNLIEDTDDSDNVNGSDDANSNSSSSDSSRSGSEGSDVSGSSESDFLDDTEADEPEPYGADGVLVIQAPQGIGKTLFCRKLAMKSEWFAEGVCIDTDNKDSKIQATSKWIVELGELDATLRHDQSSLKAFLTSATDTYRQPYGRVAVDKPRRTSFCATVNPKEFLVDETGTRRFWVIHPKAINVKKLKSLNKKWFRHLWRQVYDELYLPDPQGFRLTDEERARLEVANRKYKKPISGEIEILDTYRWDAPIELWRWKRTTEIIGDISIPNGAAKNIATATIGRALSKLMNHDARIQDKNPSNVKYYLMPPTYWEWEPERQSDNDSDALVPSRITSKK